MRPETVSLDEARSSSGTSQWPSWLREPLLHFVLLGAALFAVDAALRPVDESHIIVVGTDVDQEAVTRFQQANGRAPNERELKALLQVWVNNEVLYREGLAMGVDRGDPTIRERVIFKALSVVDANVDVAPISDDQLRAWFEQRIHKYDEPARFDFEEAALSRPSGEQEVRAFVDQLNHGTPGDAQAGLRVFKDRPYANLEQSYGAAFTQQLAASPLDTWQALQAKDGWRAVRLVGQTPAIPANFDVLRNIVLQDWRDEAAAQQRTDAVKELAKKYEVRYSTPQPEAAP